MAMLKKAVVFPYCSQSCHIVHYLEYTLVYVSAV